MEPSRTEKILSKIFSVIFNPLLLPSYIFVVFSYINSLSRIYFLLYPQLFFIALTMLVFFTALFPFIYTKHLKKQDLLITNRELLIFFLIANLMNFLLMKSFVSSTAYIPIFSSFIISFTSTIVLLIISFFAEISIYAATVSVLSATIMMFSQLGSFLSISINLILVGFVFSIYIATGKSTLKQTIIGIITAVSSVFTFLMLL